MAEVILKAECRAEGTSIKAKRREGLVPVNFYAYKQENKEYLIQEVELSKAIKSGVKVIKLDTPDGEKKAVIREVQRHPVSWALLHVDFFGLTEGRKVGLKLPLRYDGTPFGVKNQGGVLVTNARTVKVECLPENIIDEIVMDVNPLKVKDTLHARDIKLENIEVVSRPDTLLARVGLTRAAIAAATAAKKAAK